MWIVCRVIILLLVTCLHISDKFSNYELRRQRVNQNFQILSDTAVVQSFSQARPNFIPAQPAAQIQNMHTRLSQNRLNRVVNNFFSIRFMFAPLRRIFVDQVRKVKRYQKVRFFRFFKQAAQMQHIYACFNQIWVNRGLNNFFCSLLHVCTNKANFPQ